MRAECLVDCRSLSDTDHCILPNMWCPEHVSVEFCGHCPFGAPARLTPLDGTYVCMYIYIYIW